MYNAILTQAFLDKNNINVRMIDPGTELYNFYKDKSFDVILYNAMNARFKLLTEVTENECLYCSKRENLQRCSKCKEVYFCDRKCQKAAHLHHKEDCKKY